MMHLYEGIRIVHKAIKNQMEPKFETLEKPGKNAGAKAMSVYNYKTKTRAEKKSKWKVARNAIFDKLLSHCRANMKTNLYSVGNWKELEAEQNGIELIKLIDQLI